MQRSPDLGSASRIRAGAIAAVTPTLAVAAHGSGGGAGLGATGVLLLLGLSAVLMTAARSVPGLRTGVPGLVALLSAGQLAGHLTLSISGHHHGATSAGNSMLSAHVCAVGVCALLVALAERIGPRCAAALGRALPLLRSPARIHPRLPFVPVCVDASTQISAVLAASIGRRGPPTGV